MEVTFLSVMNAKKNKREVIFLSVMNTKVRKFLPERWKLLVSQVSTIPPNKSSEGYTLGA